MYSFDFLSLSLSLSMPINFTKLFQWGTKAECSTLKVVNYNYFSLFDLTSLFAPKVITYTATNTLTGLAQLMQGILDFICIDLPAPDPDSTLLQVPLAGTAMVPAYYISSLNGSLILDGDTLAMIFMGNISTWDDPAIQLLNPQLTLPHANITIGITPGRETLAETDVFKEALSQFSDEFASELVNADYDLERLRPAVEGRAFIASDASDRLAFVQVQLSSFCFFSPVSLLIISQQQNKTKKTKQQTDNSLTYLNWADAVSAGVSYAKMKNKAGNIITASATSVLSAMTDITNSFKAGNVLNHCLMLNCY